MLETKIVKELASQYSETLGKLNLPAAVKVEAKGGKLEENPEFIKVKDAVIGLDAELELMRTN